MVELRIPSDTGVSVYHCSFHCHLPFFWGGWGVEVDIKKNYSLNRPLSLSSWLKRTSSAFKGVSSVVS